MGGTDRRVRRRPGRPEQALEYSDKANNKDE